MHLALTTLLSLSTNTQHWTASMVNTILERKNLSMLGYDYKALEKLGVVHTLKLFNTHYILTIRSPNRKKKDLVLGNYGCYVKAN